MAWYDVGTVSVTNGSTTVTGSGTDFISGVQVGEGLYIGGDLYEIGVINSSTQLTLSDAYLGSTATGQAYKIIPTQSLVADLSSGVADLISDFADVRDYAGNGKFNDGTQASPAITFTQDQNNGLYRIGSDNWGMSAGGQKIVDVSTSGVDVTGTVTADGLTVDGNSFFYVDTSGYLAVAGNEGQDAKLIIMSDQGDNSPDITALTQVEGGDFTITTSNGIARLKIGSTTGDVHLFEDTGTTAKFVWDSSAESLGIGGAPATNLTISDTDNPTIRLNNTDTILAYNQDIGSIEFYTNDPSIGGIGLQAEIFAVAESSFGTNQDLVGLGFSTSLGGEPATERMRIDSSGNVGIGTASPSEKLESVTTDNTQSALSLYETTIGGESKLDFKVRNNGSNPIVMARISSDMSSGSVGSEAGDLRFHTTSAGNNAERMRINSSGNVGIGTVSPADKLDIYSLSGGLRIGTTSNSSKFGWNNSSGATEISSNGTSNWPILFKQNATERARIDSSGNLLVGTTSTIPYASDTTTGVSILGNGTITNSTTATSAIFNTLNDGKIIELRKDGSTVGSIGTGGANLGIGAGTGNLGFFDATIVPMGNTSGGASNGIINLGNTARRFKDLYLSGGVYLGGIGAANKLDDYETGTWTPTVANSGGAGYTEITNTGTYTKIGNTVFAWFDIETSDNMNDPYYTLLQGLPFTRADINVKMGTAQTPTTTLGRGVELSVHSSGTQNYVFIYNMTHDGITSNPSYADKITGFLTYRTND
jgi:hypothetical protein